MISKEPKKVILIDSSTKDVSESETAEMARLRRENELLQEKIKSLGDPWAYRKAGLEALKENRVLEALGWFEKALVSDSSVISDDDMKQLPECIDLKDGLISRVITDVDKIPEIQKKYFEFNIDVVIQGAVCFIRGEDYLRDEIRELSALSEQGQFLCKGIQSTLTVCAFLGHEKLLRHLVDCGANVNWIGVEGQTTLMAAGMMGHFGILKYLVEEKKMVVHQLDGLKRNVLFYAVRGGNLLMVKYLIEEKGMDLGQQNSLEETILFSAAQSGSLSMVTHLVEERGMDISQRNKYEETILFSAAQSGSLSMVKYLVDGKRMDISQRNRFDETLLFAAVRGGSLPMVKHLVEEIGMDTSQRNKFEETLLFNATMSGSRPMVKYFVEEKGVDINHLNHRRKTILFNAIEGGIFPIVKYLLEQKGVNIQIIDQNGKNLLCYCEDLSIIRYLLNQGLRLTTRQRRSMSKFKLALIEKEEKAYDDKVGEHHADPWLYRAEGLHAFNENRVLEALGWFEKALVSDSTVISDDDMKQLPECLELKNELVSRVITDVDKIPELQKKYSEFNIDVIIRGAICFITREDSMRDEIRELSALSEQGKYLSRGRQSILTVCAFLGYEKLLRHLMDCGADVNLIGDEGQTTLMAAGMGGHFEILKYLVEEKKMDLHQLDRFGQNVLFYGAYSGNSLMVKYLIEEKGMGLSQRKQSAEIVLFAAASSGSLPIVKYLVEERKMNIYQLNIGNETIVFAAVKSGSIPMVRYLVEERGIDVFQLDMWKRTILFYAVERSSLHMVKYLVEQKGLNVHSIDRVGNSLLCFCWHSGIIGYLMDQGLRLTHEQRNTISCYRIQLFDKAEEVNRDKVSAIQLISHSELTLKEGSNETDEKIKGDNEVPTVRSVKSESEQEMESEQKGSFHL